MSTVDYTAFLPDVNLSTTGCPEFERINRVREAAQDYCRRSFAWRARELALLTTAVAQETYDVSAVVPAGAMLVAVHLAWANGCEVDIEEPGQGDDVAPGTVGTRWTVGVDGPAALRLLPAPSIAAVAVKGTVSLCPSDDSTGMPDSLAMRWRTEIASGAIAILCAQEAKAWTNPSLAAYHKTRFDAAVMVAATRAGPVRRKGLRVSIQEPTSCWSGSRSYD